MRICSEGFERIYAAIYVVSLPSIVSNVFTARFSACASVAVKLKSALESLEAQGEKI